VKRQLIVNCFLFVCVGLLAFSTVQTLIVAAPRVWFNLGSHSFKKECLAIEPGSDFNSVQARFDRVAEYSFATFGPSYLVFHRGWSEECHIVIEPSSSRVTSKSYEPETPRGSIQ
jgi:hypothetical protein